MVHRMYRLTTYYNHHYHQMIVKINPTPQYLIKHFLMEQMIFYPNTYYKS